MAARDEDRVITDRTVQCRFPPTAGSGSSDGLRSIVLALADRARRHLEGFVDGAGREMNAVRRCAVPRLTSALLSLRT
jgi:hypothetical protein